MRCYDHSMREAAGYCVACGNFFCTKCLVDCEDGKKYCAACCAKLNIRKTEEDTPRDSRLATRLVVRLKNGKSLQGTTYKIDPERPNFKLKPFSSTGSGEEKEIEFSKVKYVALVKSLVGDKTESKGEYQPKGSEISVTFPDGESIEGFTLKAYSDKDPRFSVIPADPSDNRISIIVERSAVSKMSLGRIPKAQELRVLADNSVKRLILHYYWQHPDLFITIDELAARLERTAAVVERELSDFMREGLIERPNPDSRQLRFTPSKDPIVRQAVASMAKDIEMLYFRRKPAAEAPSAARRPARSTPQWPL